MVRSTLLFALLSVIAGIASGFELTMSSAAPTRRAWLGKAAAAPAAAAGVAWSAAAPTALADENDRRLGKRPRDEDGNLIKGGVTANGPINVNRAAAPDYMVLPGMYPTVASKLVNHVRYEGPFKSIKELYAVDGIADNEKIKALIKQYEPFLTTR